MLIPILLLETGAFPPPPSPTPHGVPYFPGGGSTGGGYTSRCDPDEYACDDIDLESYDFGVDEDGNIDFGGRRKPEAEVIDDSDISDPESDIADPAELGAPPIEGSPEPAGPPSLPAFVLDLLGPGAISFGASKRIAGLATDKWGKSGGVATSVGTTLATIVATRKSGALRLPVIAGAGIATLEMLYQQYVFEAGDVNVIRATVRAFERQISLHKCPVKVTARQETMTGRSGKVYRVFVVQYTGELFGSTWYAQEARPCKRDGSVDIMGMLLERLLPRR